MSTKTIDDFSAVSTPATTDTLLVTQGGVTKKETISQVQTLLKATDAQTVAATSVSVFVAPSNIDALKASSAQVSAGTATTCFITPSSLGGRTATITATGLVELATDAEGIAGTDDGRALTAANLKAVLQGLGYAVNTAKGTNITAAANLNINNVAGNYVGVNASGTAITTLGTGITGAERKLLFLGAVPLTHDATAHILKGGTSMTTASGDVADVICEGGSNWRYVDYSKTDGTAVSSASAGFTGKFFRVRPSAAQSMPNATYVQIQHNTELYDADGVFDSVNYRAVIPNGETWVLTAISYLELSTGNNGHWVFIYKNGAAYAFGGGYQTTNIKDNGIATTIVTGNGTDYYDVYIYNWSATRNNDNAVGATEFMGYRIK